MALAMVQAPSNRIIYLDEIVNYNGESADEFINRLKRTIDTCIAEIGGTVPEDMPLMNVVERNASDRPIRIDFVGVWEDRVFVRIDEHQVHRYAGKWVVFDTSNEPEREEIEPVLLRDDDLLPVLDYERRLK